jgi:hypothetical protein
MHSGNTMIVAPGPASLSRRSLALLKSVGAWMTIAPEQTYVATSIRGLGACRSTYCKAERRELPVRAALPGGRLAMLLAVAFGASGLLSGFAGHRHAEARDMAEPDQLGPGIADCQKPAAPVSSGASAGDAAQAGASCGSAPSVAAAGAVSAGDFDFAGSADAIARAAAAGRVGFAGG